jgi:hypothetical protein
LQSLKPFLYEVSSIRLGVILGINLTLNAGNSSNSSSERSFTSVTGTSVSGRVKIDMFCVREFLDFFRGGGLGVAHDELRRCVGSICAPRQNREPRTLIQLSIAILEGPRLRANLELEREIFCI